MENLHDSSRSRQESLPFGYYSVMLWDLGKSKKGNVETSMRLAGKKQMAFVGRGECGAAWGSLKRAQRRRQSKRK